MWVRLDKWAESDLNMAEKKALESRHHHVRKWLEKVFTGTQIPDYEVSPCHIDELHKLAEESEENEKQSEIVISELEHRIKEYESEANRLESLHECIGITIKDLPLETQHHIEILAKVANVLEITDCSSSSLSLGMSTFLKKEASLKMQIDCLSKKLQQLEEEICNVQLEKENISRLSTQLQQDAKKIKQANTQKAKHAQFLQQKSEQYEKLIASLQGELSENDYSQDIQHGALQKCHQEIKSLESQVLPLKSQLEHFADLPPNLELAKLKVEEAKQELIRLEKELSKNIDLIHAEK